MSAPHREHEGQRTFLVIWLGQFVSLMGSSMTSLALGIYIFQQTGTVTPIALIWAFTTLPGIFVAPYAGTLVDRANRKAIMVIADILAAMVTVSIAALFLTGHIALWHIYVSVMLNASFGLFQSLAYSATVTLLVPTSFLPRANGLIEVSSAVSGVATPVFAGMLYGLVGLPGIIALDFTTFLVAVGLLLSVSVPAVVQQDNPDQHRPFLIDFMQGWRFIRQHPLLLALLLFNAFISAIAVSESLITPLVLSFSSEAALGVVLGIGGLGLLLGSLYMSVVGGPKRLVIGAIALEYVAGSATFLLGLRPSVFLIAAATFVLFFTYPIISACMQSIWQRKTPAHLQGRVFATRRMVTWASLPLAFVLAGPLIDNVLQPAMHAEGLLADSVGNLIGVGAGRGVALLMVTTGSINVLGALVAWFGTDLRLIERVIPDANEGVT